MKKFLINNKFIFITLFLLASFNSSFAAQSLNSVVAFVNDQPITQTQLDHEVTLAKKNINYKSSSHAVFKKQILDRLIDQTLQLQKAKEVGIVADDGSIDKAIASIAKTNNMTIAQLEAMVKKNGLTIKEYRNNIGKQMVISSLQQQAVGVKAMITKADVDAVLAKQRKNTIKEYRVMDLLVPVSEYASAADAQEARTEAYNLVKQINKAHNFEAVVAGEVSLNIAVSGGDLDWRPLGQLPSIFAGAIKDMKVGSISTPIKTANGYHILKLLATRNKAPKGAMTKQQAEKIAQQNKAEKVVKEWLKKLRASSYIKIEPQS